MKVYQAINAVQAALSAQGIAKNKRNTQGTGYNFRGIDDVYNALAPELAKNGLVVIPRVMSRDAVERTSRQGGALFYITVDVEFDFVSSEDGSKHTARTFGEAMDSGDKATNKAMSAAFKYAMFQTFCIPTEAQDADAETHEVEAKEKELTAEELRKVAHDRALATWGKSVAAIKAAVQKDDAYTVREVWAELDNDSKQALWIAPSKGGCFTTAEREYIRTAMSAKQDADSEAVA